MRHILHIIFNNNSPVEIVDSAEEADWRVKNENRNSGGTIKSGIFHVKTVPYVGGGKINTCFFCTLPIEGSRREGWDRVMQSPVCGHCLERVRYEQEHYYNPMGVSLYNAVPMGEWAPEKVIEHLRRLQDKVKEYEKKEEGHAKIAKIAASGNRLCEHLAEKVDMNEGRGLDGFETELLDKWRVAIGYPEAKLWEPEKKDG
jgi:hypothetical protein